MSTIRGQLAAGDVVADLGLDSDGVTCLRRILPFDQKVYPLVPGRKCFRRHLDLAHVLAELRRSKRLQQRAGSLDPLDPLRNAKKVGEPLCELRLGKLRPIDRIGPKQVMPTIQSEDPAHGRRSPGPVRGLLEGESPAPDRRRQSIGQGLAEGNQGRAPFGPDRFPEPECVVSDRPRHGVGEHVADQTQVGRVERRTLKYQPVPVAG